MHNGRFRFAGRHRRDVQSVSHPIAAAMNARTKRARRRPTTPASAFRRVRSLSAGSRLRPARPIQPLAPRGIAPGHFAPFLNLTPGPPPFSAMNSTPADSRAATIFARATADTRGPRHVSSRTTDCRASPALSASEVCDHPRSPLAARIWVEIWAERHRHWAYFQTSRMSENHRAIGLPRYD